jgi:hypothetical protein
MIEKPQDLSFGKSTGIAVEVYKESNQLDQQSE